MIRAVFGFVVAVALAAGCLGDTGEPTEEASQAVKASDAEIAANCALNNPKKEAVCHIPPGNPANAHTICISKAAVQTHLTLHGDYLGACKDTSGTGGNGSTGQGGASAAGTGGASSAGAGGSTGSGDSCTGAPPCSSNADCDSAHSCVNGCCVPLLK